MQTIYSIKLSRLRERARHLAIPSLLFLTSLPLYAQSSDPWDNAVNVLKTAFTGSIATGLSLVAIVIGGLMFAYGEGQSKKTLAGIVFGVGMAIGAVKFNRWYTSDELVNAGGFPAHVRDTVLTLIQKRKNGIISGGTGSG